MHACTHRVHGGGGRLRGTCLARQQREAQHSGSALTTAAEPWAAAQSACYDACQPAAPMLASYGRVARPGPVVAGDPHCPDTAPTSPPRHPLTHPTHPRNESQPRSAGVVERVVMAAAPAGPVLQPGARAAVPRPGAGAGAAGAGAAAGGLAGLGLGARAPGLQARGAAHRKPMSGDVRG